LCDLTGRSCKIFVMCECVAVQNKMPLMFYETEIISVLICISFIDSIKYTEEHFWLQSFQFNVRVSTSHVSRGNQHNCLGI